MIGAKILLVDDEEVFVRNMSKLLMGRGYNVTTAANGIEAIEVLEKKPVDVVVLDLKMPGMDGIATLKAIRNSDLFSEILILTGHGSIDSALEAVKLGAYDYLTKPCEIDELVEKIEGAWEKKDYAIQQNMMDNIQKVVESPKSVFNVFPKRAKHR